MSNNGLSEIAAGYGLRAAMQFRDQIVRLNFLCGIDPRAEQSAHHVGRVVTKRAIDVYNAYAKQRNDLLEDLKKFAGKQLR